MRGEEGLSTLAPPRSEGGGGSKLVEKVEKEEKTGSEGVLTDNPLSLSILNSEGRGKSLGGGEGLNFERRE